jgi:predicted NBD/HSP70 family sugar kinase
MVVHGRASESAAHPGRSIDGVPDAVHLRRLNLDRVFSVAMSHTRAFTRAELMAATGLSAPTIGTLATELIQKGFITDLGSGPSRGGRRPTMMQFNARRGLVCGMDIGPTRTRLALADIRGEIIGRKIVATGPEDNPCSLVDTLAAHVEELLRDSSLTADQLRTVVAAIPGPVDPTTGVAFTMTSGTARWLDVPLADLLRKSLGAPAVVENEVNLAILGEQWRGAAQGHDTCAFLTFGTSVGAGLIVNGMLHHGVHFAAGEIGEMCVRPDAIGREACGCLEGLVGIPALAEKWAAAGGACGEDAPPELFAAARLGNPRANAIVTEAAILIGLAAAHLNLLLDPSLIVMGGALISDNPTLVDQVRAIVGRFVRSPAEIAITALGEEAPLWGSLLVATSEARARIRSELLEGRT